MKRGRLLLGLQELQGPPSRKFFLTFLFFALSFEPYTALHIVFSPSLFLFSSPIVAPIDDVFVVNVPAVVNLPAAAAVAAPAPRVNAAPAVPRPRRRILKRSSNRTNNPHRPAGTLAGGPALVQPTAKINVYRDPVSGRYASKEKKALRV